MTPDEILTSLFPDGHSVSTKGSLLAGTATMRDGRQIQVIGVTGRSPIGVDEAIVLSRRVLDIAVADASTPIFLLLDSDSQRMSKRDELLGLSEFLSHLAKCLILAEQRGHRTIGLLYGHSAAGAFIATALSTRTLVALPSADPAVMDLPSMARVTKLSIDVLQEKARSTPVFAPGVDNIERMGAIREIWDEKESLGGQLETLLANPEDRHDARDRLGAERQGRLKAAEIAGRVYALALGRG